MAVEIAKHAFTVIEFNQMAEAGILTGDDRLELIEGEIIEMSPIGKRHAACVDRLAERLSRSREDLIVRVQGPIQLDDYSEPQPDLVLLQRRDDFYAGSLPKPADVLLVIEVSDTSMDYDHLVKLPAYARSGIPEVWIMNLSADEIRFCSGWQNGAYQIDRPFRRGEVIRSNSVTNLALSVNEIIG